MTEAKFTFSPEVLGAFANRADVAGVAVMAGQAIQGAVTAIQAIRAGDLEAADEALKSAEVGLQRLSDIFDNLSGYRFQE